MTEKNTLKKSATLAAAGLVVMAVVEQQAHQKNIPLNHCCPAVQKSKKVIHLQKEKSNVFSVILKLLN